MSNCNWIYRGFMPKPGSVFSVMPDQFEPVPDDVVLVPREKIERMRSSVFPAIGYCGTRECGDHLSNVVNRAYDIIACADQQKPKDEILDALIAAKNRLQEVQTVSAEGVLERQKAAHAILSVQQAILARERELKERK